MPSDRRMFLSAGLGVTAALASELTTSAQAVDRPPLPGNVSLEPEVRAATAHDFGRLIHRQPRGVLRPASSADIVSLMRWAKGQGVKVAARGQGHSIYGRALVEDGIVVDMSAMNAIRDIQQDRVAVDAGATWRDLLDATLALALTPPVLTNYLGLSVGGTIAVGGIGATSSRHGMQTDNVIALDVVTGEGKEVSCSATENPDLFDGTRAGLGQCSIVTRATLRLVPAPERVRRFQLFYRDLPSLAADQRRVLTEGRFDQLQGAVLPDGSGGWRYQLDGAVYHATGSAPDDKAVLSGLSDERSAAVITDLTYREDALAFGKFETLLRSKGQWSNPQPWFLTFLRGSNAERLAAGILAGLKGDAVGPFGRITFYPLFTKAFRTPLVRLPAEDIVFVFNLIRIPASNDAATAERMLAENRMLYDRIREAGGIQYPVGAFAMSSDDWTAHFGSGWPQLREAKQRYDPGHLLAPGYNLF
ncbi:FAD-binding protein [Bradyrhizobium sp. AUGA SZCCT0283]|uniref:FAD-binding protein n=1 Tax=Bradyrhizobium sp. AUGA SZCCT0283 TaxID=2807671 RepID=UPI001BA8EFF8|nr:FAD-binding protein [Bradyrhizobium sp. AUGA SZCCT0283]MBR1275178.1 FAD-binding protein [Bradyrhizobium sp. AUGA SZCCT0283]